MNNKTKFHREVEAGRNHGADTGERSGPAGRHRVLRGGSWNNNERGNAWHGSAHSIAERKLHGGRSRNLLSSNRNHNTPTNRNNNGLAFASRRLCVVASLG